MNETIKIEEYDETVEVLDRLAGKAAAAYTSLFQLLDALKSAPPEVRKLCPETFEQDGIKKLTFAVKEVSNVSIDFTFCAVCARDGALEEVPSV